jgi:Uma2 family endonuclease
MTSWLSKHLILAVAETASVRVGNPVGLGTFSEPEPDLVILMSVPDDYMRAHPHAEDVLLLVEVADASLDFDLGLKRDLYARYHVSEYWIVDAIHERVLAHRQQVDGAFQ